MLDEIVTTFLETMKIILIITLLMIIIEFLELKFENKIREKITRKPVNQFVIASLLGSIPGCVDSFFIVSLYVHGLVGFGALAAVMLSTAGDDAFIMLAMIPETALLIFAISVILGIVGGFFADKIAKAIKLKTCQPCEIEIHEKELDFKHFLKEHVFGHVLKKHIPKLFLWIFFTMLAIGFLVENFNLEPIVTSLPVFLLIVFAALIGIIPESGPHLFFLLLFSKGFIPFSVLLVNTISQDGHGLLPLLSYSVKDTIYVQIFTTLFALAVGIVLFSIGV
ncbi:MAG: arsenic efflux protein [Candidatus Bathyarchaeota archaeon]|nr:arsenic efflux protein [Candidatus Bathyarchaeota archaeon]MDH5531978.1 arsenic efflux protein [Candidatus Bathyarchaeota archaeon]